MDSDDERAVELSTLTAIFPELTVDDGHPYAALLDVPVVPSSPLPVRFAGPEGETGLVHHLAYLPPLQVKVSLPDGYPAAKPPSVELSAHPAWISRDVLDRLAAEAHDLWEQLGRDQVIYSYVDALIQSADTAFGVLGDADEVVLPREDQISMLDFNISATRDVFEKKSYQCGICLERKSGKICHEMLDCQHVYCKSCLQEFYTDAIRQGDISTVRCVHPDCVKKLSTNLNKKGQPKSSITPNELLQIPLEYDAVKRYVTLKHKMLIESDKSTVFCPRSWCAGAARSKKYRKPQGLEVVDAEDSDEETGPAEADLLRICEECHYAFCRRCLKGWHGELVICLSPARATEVSAEEKASLDYMALHTTRCPTCSVAAQKAYGCNHMICFQCRSHFCYLCAAWLEPSNPYRHFNDERTPCYMRLWELEAGDGNDTGIGYAGGPE